MCWLLAGYTHCFVTLCALCGLLFTCAEDVPRADPAAVTGLCWAVDGVLGLLLTHLPVPLLLFCRCEDFSSDGKVDGMVAAFGLFVDVMAI